jgi:hypothetical protein
MVGGRENGWREREWLAGERMIGRERMVGGRENDWWEREWSVDERMVGGRENGWLERMVGGRA